MNRKIIIRNLKGFGHFVDGYVKTLQAGDVVGLIGDLGAGKTTFVQHVAKTLGLKRPVRSPTFVLLQEYKLSAARAKQVGFKRLVHIDAYRLESDTELWAIGFQDYVNVNDAVILIEWADRIERLKWLDRYREIKFEFGENNDRILSIDNGF